MSRPAHPFALRALQWTTATRVRAVLTTVGGILVVGLVDWSTGSEVRIYPLYFLPLSICGWALGERGALSASVGATTVWLIANTAAGLTYSEEWIWGFNAAMQSAAFLTVSLLLAHLRGLLDREQNLAATDPLTGLPNRRAFYEHAAADVARCHRHVRPITLAYLDIDNFKVLNDRLGHAAGDTLLREVAGILRGAVRGGDLVGRIGGDEFVLCLPETGPAEAGVVLQRVHEALRAHLAGTKAPVSSTIGAVSWVLAPPDLDDMVHAADRLMYDAKRAGKDRLTLNAA